MQGLSLRFRSQHFFVCKLCVETQIYSDLNRDAILVIIRMGTNMPETNRNICHYVLLQKREFISRGSQKTLKYYFFQYTNCRGSQIPLNKSLFNQHNSSSGRHVNAASRKSLNTITKLRTHLLGKFA